MLTDEARELLKGATGVTDDQLANIRGGEAKLWNNMMKTAGMQTIAEVVKSERCFAQVKVGDKLVFDPFLNPEKSSGVMCPKALLPVMSQIGAIWEMSLEWAVSGKEEFPEIVWSNVRCLDPGIENGGLGEVVYSFRIEPIA